MVQLARVDAELVRRGLARSRAQAAELIAAGRVTSNGKTLTKPATRIALAAPLVVAAVEDDPDYASRGAYKLAGVLEALGTKAPVITGKRCLDAGASTGGFTDVLLRAGAQRVIAADVGYGQLIWRLQQDPRVIVMDRTNIRYLQPSDLPYLPDLIVSDLSFISLTLVIPALSACLASEGEMLLMVKPQFEVGKDRLGAGGVVRDPQLQVAAVAYVAHSVLAHGLKIKAVAASPLPGPAGNVEYFISCQRDSEISLPAQTRQGISQTGDPVTLDTALSKLPPELAAQIETAIAEGPTCAPSK